MMWRSWRRETSAAVMLAWMGTAGTAAAPQAPAPPPVVEKLGPTLMRVGGIRVDLAKREISMPATINDVLVLEFVANVAKGLKAYESAMTIQTDAITFNTALLLIGLDKANARVPTQHFDPIAPAGDPVEMWIEWKNGATARRVGVEELLFDRQLGKTVPPSTWVYTGSAFLPDGRYWADADGILIGFVHSPAPIIENIAGVGVNRYGAVVLNPNIGLSAGLEVMLTVKAVGPVK
jgi:hypothetical protein